MSNKSNTSKTTRERAAKALDTTIRNICDQVENPSECRGDLNSNLRTAEALTAYLYPYPQPLAIMDVFMEKIPDIMKKAKETAKVIDALDEQG